MRSNQDPPERIRAWMDRLSVDHHYDPETGFIVARETIGLPDVIGGASSLEASLESEAPAVVFVFATADRCAPCQQFKLDALNDARVIERLGGVAVAAVHVEVDREGEIADRYLGTRAIPMTHAFVNGNRVSALPGQRSADELLAWIDEIEASHTR